MYIYVILPNEYTIKDNQIQLNAFYFYLKNLEF